MGEKVVAPMASYDSPQFGLYPRGEPARVKIHQTVETDAHGTKHMYIDHYSAAERRKYKHKGIFDYGMAKEYDTATSREEDWSPTTGSVWNMSLRRTNSLLNPSHDTWVYGIENQAVVQKLGYGYNGSHPDNEDVYLVIAKQNGPSEFQGYIQLRENGQTYYLVLIDNYGIAPNRSKLDVGDYAQVSWLPLNRLAEAESYPQALWTFTLDPKDPRGKRGDDAPKLLDCQACECPKSSGEELKDKRNERSWALIDLESERKTSYAVYDEATLTGPQWAYRNAKYPATEKLACKTAAEAIGGRCEVLGESFLGPSREVPDEYAEGKENVAYKFAYSASSVAQSQADAACRGLGAGWSLATREAIEGNKEALKRSRLRGMVGGDSWQNGGSEEKPKITWGYNYMGSDGGRWKRANTMAYYKGRLPAVCMNPKVFDHYGDCSPLKFGEDAFDEEGGGGGAKVSVPCTDGAGGGRAQAAAGALCSAMDHLEKMRHHAIHDGALLHQAMVAMEGATLGACLTPSGGKGLRYKAYDGSQRASRELTVTDDTWSVGVYDEGEKVFQHPESVPFKRLYLQRTSDEKYLQVDPEDGKPSYSSERVAVGYAVEFRDERDEAHGVWVIRLDEYGESYLISKGASPGGDAPESLATTASLGEALLHGWRFVAIATDCPQVFTTGDGRFFGPTFASCPALFSGANLNKKQSYINGEMQQRQGLSFTPIDVLKNWDHLWKKCGGDTNKALTDTECANFKVVREVIDKWDPSGDTEFKRQYPTQSDDGDGDRSITQGYVRFCAQPVTAGCLPTVDTEGKKKNTTSCPYIKQTGLDGTTKQDSSTAYCKAANDDPTLKRQTFIEFCRQCKKATPDFNSNVEAEDLRYAGCREVCGCILRLDDDDYVAGRKRLKKALGGTGQLPPEKCGWWNPCSFDNQSEGLTNPYLIADKVTDTCPDIQSCYIEQNIEVGRDVKISGNGKFNISASCKQNDKDKEVDDKDKRIKDMVKALQDKHKSLGSAFDYGKLKSLKSTPYIKPVPEGATETEFKVAVANFEKDNPQPKVEAAASPIGSGPVVAVVGVVTLLAVAALVYFFLFKMSNKKAKPTG